MPGRRATVARANLPEIRGFGPQRCGWHAAGNRRSNS
jgi:hypothetical protein